MKRSIEKSILLTAATASLAGGSIAHAAVLYWDGTSTTANADGGNGSVVATGKTLVAAGTFAPGTSPGSFDVTAGAFTLGGSSASTF